MFKISYSHQTNYDYNYIGWSICSFVLIIAGLLNCLIPSSIEKELKLPKIIPPVYSSYPVEGQNLDDLDGECEETYL